MTTCRQNTNRLLEQVEEGYLDPMYVLHACLGALSEDDVTTMMRANEIDTVQSLAMDAEEPEEYDMAPEHT